MEQTAHSEPESIDSPYKTRSRLSVSVGTLNRALSAVSALPHKAPTQLLTAKSLHWELKKEETLRRSVIFNNVSNGFQKPVLSGILASISDEFFVIPSPPLTSFLTIAKYKILKITNYVGK